jgi:hypothetical protein
VIVPVHLPALTGYFAHGLEILHLMLESVALTTANRAAVTVIVNGCAPEVLSDLQARLDAGTIDQLVVNRQNRGKVDAVVSVTRTAYEDLITLADADVLFVPGWLDAVEQVFSAFPECAVVSPSPNPALAATHTLSTILGLFFTRESRVAHVVPDADLDRFAKSVGDPNWFSVPYREAHLSVERTGTLACVGAGHYVITMRREIVAAMPTMPSLQALKEGAEQPYLDQPPDRAGLWKLSTPRAFAYHMGNHPEPWMYEELERARAAPVPASSVPSLPPLHRPWTAAIPWMLRRRLGALLWKWKFLPWLKHYRSGQIHARAAAGPGRSGDSELRSRRLSESAVDQK